jgi:pimeloyl-ACP methyl ester carboxylesterase
LAPVGVKSLSLIAFGILIILGAAGSTYELIATYSFRRHGAHGELVTVRGYRQYIDCRGTGSPTIVFDGGLGDASDVWRDLHAQAAQISKACIFDRLGNGWSDDGPKPRSSEQMAGELHALLSASGQTAPYVLVAHSMAGYNARLFVSHHPQEVSGVLLLDVSHPDQNRRESRDANADRTAFIKKQAWWARLAPIGVTRLLGHCEWSPQDCRRSYRTTLDEFGPFNDLSPAEVRAAGTMGSVPLVVVAHDPEVAMQDDPGDAGRMDATVDLQMQRELSMLSANSCMIIARRSRHYIQDSRPDIVLKSLELLVQTATLKGLTDFKSRCEAIAG